jgi:hypothetical protein
MTDGQTRQPPAWVYKRDGRLVPFEADKICRSLFSATEQMGAPNAFLARELTDGVVHFLASECDEATPTTAQIAESVVKTVRELGQPALALAYGEGIQRRKPIEASAPTLADNSTRRITFQFSANDSPTDVFCRFSRKYTQEVVFSRDIVAAHQEGLLMLAGLERPQNLEAWVLEQLPPGRTFTEAFFDSRALVSNYLNLDGPEFLIGEYLRSIRREQNELANATVKRWWLRELATSFQAAGFRAIVNLNCPSPPLWAEDLANGPLFVDQGNAPDPKRQSVLSLALLADMLHGDLGHDGKALQVNWHLNEKDLAPESQEKLAEVIRLSMEKGHVTFVFDRPRHVISLGECLDRKHPAILTSVGLNLPGLAEKQGVLNNPARFLEKVASLARMAITAAIQKRDFLRVMGKNHPALLRGFLIERARLLAAPIGLEHVVRAMTGESICQEAGLRFAKQIVERLKSILETEGQSRRLLTCLGGSLNQSFTVDDSNKANQGHEVERFPRLDEVAGLVPWNSEAPWKIQLRSASSLHTVAGQGTAAVVIPDEHIPSPKEVGEWLAWTWQNTDLTSLRLVRSASVHKQLTLDIKEKA